MSKKTEDKVKKNIGISNSSDAVSSDVDKMLYNERSLNLLTIHDLRDIGRKFGVPSPTTMNKVDLIDYILKIVYGEVDTPMRKPMGRPSSHEFNIDGYLERIRKNAPIADELSKLRLYDNVSVAKVSSPASEYVSDAANIQTKVLCEVNGKFVLRTCAYIESNDDIVVSDELVKNHNLENFDVLEIYVFDNLIKIITVNGQKIEDKFTNLYVNGYPIVSGMNKVIRLKTSEEVTDSIKYLAGEASKRNITLALFTNNNKTKPNKNIITVNYNPADNASVIYKKFMQLIGECERVVSSSGNLMVIIEDKSQLDQAISSFDPDVAERINIKLNEDITKFSRLGNVCLMFVSELK